MEIDRKDVKIGEIYIGFNFNYLTIEKILNIDNNMKITTNCYFIGILDFRFGNTKQQILVQSYNLYDFNDFLSEKDLKPYHEQLRKLIEYFESFPENKVWSRKRKLKLLEEYGK